MKLYEMPGEPRNFTFCGLNGNRGRGRTNRGSIKLNSITWQLRPQT